MRLLNEFMLRRRALGEPGLAWELYSANAACPLALAWSSASFSPCTPTWWHSPWLNVREREGGREGRRGGRERERKVGGIPCDSLHSGLCRNYKLHFQASAAAVTNPCMFTLFLSSRQTQFGS